MFELIKYLGKIDISRDFVSFSDTLVNEISKSDELRNKVASYYDVKKEYADRLVMEDEFVGRTYDNLESIEKVLTLK